MLSRLLALFLITTGINASELSNYERIESIEQLERFAFGSCNSPYNEQPLWEWIIKEDPQLWLWGGDNIYAETEEPELVKQTYEMQNNVPGYKELKAQAPIIGVWDDHDYGYDNADFTNPMKVESQKHFLDFMEEPKDSPRRKQEGIYTSYDIGAGDTKVKFILLDNRYFLNNPDEEDNILGEKQWRWFERQIQESDAKINFIVSGLSVLSYVIRRTEEWIDHRPAFDRMRSLLDKHNPSGVIFLTGDKHFSSIFNRFGHLEFMSSGLSHTVEGKLVRTYVSRFYPNSFFGKNYGMVKIDWNSKPLAVELSIKSFYPRPAFKFRYVLNPLNKWELEEPQ